MKKYYNITINILFWTLAVFISFAAVMSMIAPEQVTDSIWPREEKLVVRTQVRNEPVIFNIEKDIEWYYFEATGYSANDPAQGTDSTTATGIEAEPGIVAVDPEVIPLGTEIEIKGIGKFVAEDTGGKIKGNRIDIFFDSKQKAMEFGREGVWVRIEDKDVYTAHTFR